MTSVTPALRLMLRTGNRRSPRWRRTKCGAGPRCRGVAKSIVCSCGANSPSPTQGSRHVQLSRGNPIVPEIDFRGRGGVPSGGGNVPQAQTWMAVGGSPSKARPPRSSGAKRLESSEPRPLLKTEERCIEGTRRNEICRGIPPRCPHDPFCSWNQIALEYERP